MPESVAESRERALVANGDELAALLHHPATDVLLALLDNPAFDEPRLCSLLERKDLPREDLFVPEASKVEVRQTRDCRAGRGTHPWPDDADAQPAHPSVRRA